MKENYILCELYVEAYSDVLWLWSWNFVQWQWHPHNSST